MKDFHKVPRREIYCHTWRSWLANVVLCFVVYKLDPPAKPALAIPGGAGEPKASCPAGTLTQPTYCTQHPDGVARVADPQPVQLDRSA